jgi:hypothetical protein
MELYLIYLAVVCFWAFVWSDTFAEFVRMVFFGTVYVTLIYVAGHFIIKYW